MDATMQTVLRLHEQGIPRRTIAKRAGISLQKVRKILITAGAWSDETSEKIGKLRANGMSVPEIAEKLGVKTNTVWSYLPYRKACIIKNIRPLTPFESEIRSEKQKKKPSPARIPHRMRAVALAEGFEPSDSLPSSVFWTDFINHSNKQADGAEGEIRTHMPRFPRRQLSKLLPYR